MDQSQKDVLRTITLIGGSLSLASTIIAFILFWFFKENRSFTLEIQMYLTLSIFLYSLSSLLPYDVESVWCPIQSYLINTSLTSLSIWSTIMGYSCLISMVHKTHLEHHKKLYRLIFFSCAFALPLALSSVILFTKIYGDSNGICWLDVQTEYRLMYIFKMVMMFYLIDWYIIIVNVFFILKIFIMSRRSQQNKNELYSYIKWYPIVNVLCEAIATINRIYGLLKGKKITFIFSILQVIFDSFEGLVFVCIFLFSPGISQSVVVFWRRIFNGRNKSYATNSIKTGDSSILDDNALFKVNNEETDITRKNEEEYGFGI